MYVNFELDTISVQQEHIPHKIMYITQGFYLKSIMFFSLQFYKHNANYFPVRVKGAYSIGFFIKELFSYL